MSTTDKLNGFGPLAGVKVVELCEWVAAPAAVRCLSEMGATVIKTEPLHGDAQRTQGPGLRKERLRRSYVRPEQHQQGPRCHQPQGRGRHEVHEEASC